MEIRRVSGLEDQRICVDIFVRAIDDLHQRNRQPPMDTSDMGWVPASLAYFADADPEGLVLAVGLQRDRAGMHAGGEGQQALDTGQVGHPVQGYLRHDAVPAVQHRGDRLARLDDRREVHR